MLLNTTNRRNQTFQYLKALGIIMVIDDHVSTRIGILSSIFPYNSFYMPMFVFISGYFYKETSVGMNLKHKAYHLLLPYLIWGIAGDFIAFILEKAGIVHWFTNPFDYDKISHFFKIGSLSTLTEPAWFAIMLFWVSVLYNIIHRILDLNTSKHNYALLLVNVVLGFISLYLCINHPYYWWSTTFLHRTVWYMQFYHIGNMFHVYWEKHVRDWPLIGTCAICIAVNIILICIYGDSINFYSTEYMGSFNSWWLPIITSATGTLFWYKIADLLASKIGQTKVVDFIAENTFTIMCSHLMFANIPNFYAYYQFKHGNISYADFPAAFFQNSAGVRYSPNTRLVGFFCGLLGSLLTAWVINMVKLHIVSIMKNKICPMHVEKKLIL